MRTVAIIQARMTSTRLPGKVLSDIEGYPMLEHELARIKHSSRLDDVIVATTLNATDNPVAALCDRLDTRVFRGSEDHVLSRYLGAADVSMADVVVRVTADCPL